jgi:ribosomal protein S18 acetylase RimI-like enzyme
MADVSITKISLELIDSVAQLHMAAFKGYTNTLIGIPYVRAFIRWFCEADEAIALCAIDSTKTPVGYVVGAPLGYTTHLNQRVLWPAVTGILLRPWLVFNPRFRRIVANRFRSLKEGGKHQSNEIPILPSPTISLVGIGVHPEYRDKKIGHKLITEFESSVVEAQAKSMRLSVYSDNIAACKFYAKAGWQIFDNVIGPFVYYYKVV